MKEIETKGTHAVSSNILFKPDANDNIINMSLPGLQKNKDVWKQLKEYINIENNKYQTQDDVKISVEYSPHLGKIHYIIQTKAGKTHKISVPESVFNIKTTDKLTTASRIAEERQKIIKELDKITDSTEKDRLSNEMEKLSQHYASQLIQNGVEFNKKLEVK